MNAGILINNCFGFGEKIFTINDQATVFVKKFERKIVTYIRKFEKFYIAEKKHQDFYIEKFASYLRYKKACGRERILNKIWN